MRLQLLGSGGWIPSEKRETCCALVREAKQAALIDAGTGLHRLIESPTLLAGAERLDIILTHFHLDHVVGLAFVPALGLDVPPRIHGPGAWLYQQSTQEILEQLLGPPLLHADFEAIASEVVELEPGSLELGPFAVQLREQRRHSAPTAALRFGDLFTYCTDTAYDDGNRSFAAGSKLLIHEAWYVEDHPQDAHTHASAREAGELAEAAQAEQLVMIHIHPRADERKLLTEAQASFKKSVVAEDGMEFD